MAILVVGGDSVDGIKERAQADGHGCVKHWSGRKTRGLLVFFQKRGNHLRGPGNRLLTMTHCLDSAP